MDSLYNIFTRRSPEVNKVAYEPIDVSVAKMRAVYAEYQKDRDFVHPPTIHTTYPIRTERVVERK